MAARLSARQKDRVQLSVGALVLRWGVDHKKNGRRYSVHVKDAARQLRQAAASLDEIASCLGVSQGIVQVWVRDVALAREQTERLNRRGMEGSTIYARARREARWAQHWARAESLWNDYIQEPLFALGLGLYWGEGDKRNPNRVVISNADPAFIRTWLSWCRKYLPSPGVILSVYIQRDVRPVAAIRYWRKELSWDRPIQAVRCVPKGSPGKQPLRKLPFGTLRVVCMRGTRACQMIKIWLKLAAWVRKDGCRLPKPKGRAHFPHAAHRAPVHRWPRS